MPHWQLADATGACPGKAMLVQSFPVTPSSPSIHGNTETACYPWSGVLTALCLHHDISASCMWHPSVIAMKLLYYLRVICCLMSKDIISVALLGYNGSCTGVRVTLTWHPKRIRQSELNQHFEKKKKFIGIWNFALHSLKLKLFSKRWHFYFFKKRKFTIRYSRFPIGEMNGNRTKLMGSSILSCLATMGAALAKCLLLEYPWEKGEAPLPAMRFLDSAPAISSGCPGKMRG